MGTREIQLDVFAVSVLIWFGVASAVYAAFPAFPQAMRFNPKAAPKSAQQQASMVLIPGRTYTIGAPSGDPRAALDALPAHPIKIAPFRIDRTEVTNEQFAEYLNALPVSPVGTALGGDLDPENIPEDHQYLLLQYLEPRPPYPIIQLDDEEARIGMRDGLFVANPGFENHPVAETTWAGAVTYCAWRGARLPTEVEWEAAARGKEGRVYPWGEAPPTMELAVIHRESGDTLPVGSAPRGATPKGLLDMAGSLQEWTSTLYRPYPYRANDGREDLTQPGERVTRGGDYVFEVAPDKLTTWHRTGYSRRVSSGHRQIGFRCAAKVSDPA